VAPRKLLVCIVQRAARHLEKQLEIRSRRKLKLLKTENGMISIGTYYKFGKKRWIGKGHIVKPLLIQGKIWNECPPSLLKNVNWK
jgi:hypothetical protein